MGAFRSRSASLFILAAMSVVVLGCSGAGGGSGNPGGGAAAGNATGISVDAGGAVDVSGFAGTISGGSETGAPCYWHNGTLTTMSAAHGSTVWVNWTAVDGSNDLYVAGGEGSSGSTPTPVFWENGAVTSLPMTSGDTYGLALGAAVSTSNVVYIMGYEGTSSSAVVPCYWQSGTLKTLTLSSGSITYGYGLAISATFDSSGTLYIAGQVGLSGSSAQSPCYWVVSGTGQTLNVLLFNSGDSYGGARNIAIDGSGTLYVSGIEGPSNTSLTPCYWAGTTATIGSALPTDLLLGSGYTDFYIEWGGLVSVPSTDNLYIVGSVGTSTSDEVPAYWDISGSSPTLTPTILPLGSGNIAGYANGIAFDGANPANVYITGTVVSSGSTPVPVYWKNGAFTALTTASSKSASREQYVSIGSSSLARGGEAQLPPK